MSKSSNGLVVVLFIVGLAVGAGSGYLLFNNGSSEFEKELESANGTITELNSQINEYKSEIESLNSNLETLENQIETYREFEKSYNYLQVNGSNAALHLIREKSDYPWEDGYGSSALKAVYLVHRADWWGDEVYQEMAAVFIDNEIEILEDYRYAAESSYLGDLERSIGGKLYYETGEFPGFIHPFDKYNSSQIGIIIIGHSEIFTINDPSSYTYLDQVRWFYITPNSSYAREYRFN